jgi:hypothetical protein
MAGIDLELIDGSHIMPYLSIYVYMSLQWCLLSRTVYVLSVV